MNFVALTRNMAMAAQEIEDLPDDFEMTAEFDNTLEGVRYAAIELKQAIEALFESIRGRGES